MPEDTDTAPEAPEEGQPPAPEDTDKTEAAEGAENVEAKEVVAKVTDPVIEALREEGFDHSFKDAKDVAKGYAELRRSYSTVDEERAVGREVLPHLEEYRNWVKSQEEEKKPKVWDIPALPTNFDQQMALPEDQWDPTFKRQHLERTGFLEAKWAGYSADPGLLFNDHFRGPIQEMIGESIKRSKAEADLRKDLAPHEDFIMKHYDEVEELARNMPLASAVELAQLRATGSKVDKDVDSAAALERDRETLAAGKPAPSGVAKVEEEAEASDDDHAIAQKALKDARLTSA